MKILGMSSLAIAIFISTPALADSLEIELGWGNLPECTRMVASGGSIFGGGFRDTLEKTPQRVTAYLHVEAPSVDSVRSAINHCAFNVALPRATLAAILGDPSLAQPVFFESFNSCMAGLAWSSLSLYTKTQCEGW